MAILKQNCKGERILKMRLKIKSAKSVQIVPATKSYCLAVVINGVEVSELLKPIDIMVAIDYFGITELLDAIGEQQLKLYLACLDEDDNQRGTAWLDLQETANH